jgi:hypothetical protein
MSEENEVNNDFDACNNVGESEMGVEVYPELEGIGEGTDTSQTYL